MNIPNVKNYAGHGSSAQKSIWHCMMMLARFEAVKIDNNNFDEKTIIAGEKEFYQFIKNLYKDMYENPDKYAIPTADYDDYIKNKNSNEEPFVKMHKTDQMECKLRNTFQQAIQFYPDYFYKLGLAADGLCKKTFSLVIAKSKYNNVLQTLAKPHIYKENTQRINALTDLGIVLKEAGETYYISSKKAPKMFLGLWVLCSAPESKYKYMNYLRLDYKGYYRYMPTIEDVKLTMTKEHAEKLDTILETFNNTKTKYKIKPIRSITSSHGWKVEYTFNGKNIFGFFAEPDYLVLYVYFNNAKNITEMSKKIEMSDAPLFNWFKDKFPERLCKCPSNRVVTFGNIKRRICGLSNRAEIINPDKNDTGKSIAIIKMFRGLMLFLLHCSARIDF